MQTFVVDNTTRLSRPIMVAGFGIGLLLSAGVLTGDNAGRVNLLYLLLVFSVIPFVGAIVSIVSLLRGKGVNFARVISLLPIWPKAFQRSLHKIRQMQMDKQWFFLQSQAAALAYSIASLLMFTALLLATDINFVWRSTLLDAEQLLPLLTLVASPWYFWDAAQPSIELLQITQDSRLTQSYSDAATFGQWWPFVMATLLVYSLLLRGILLGIAKVWLRMRAQRDIDNTLGHEQHTRRIEPHTPKLASITHSLPADYAVNNWAKIEPTMLDKLALAPTKMMPSGSFDGQQLLLVKAWEPPLGELQDLMQSGQGLLFPVEYKGGELMAPHQRHVDEWRRFVNNLPNWCIYLPAEWMNQHAN